MRDPETGRYENPDKEPLSEQELNFMYAPKKAGCKVCTIPQPGWSEVNAAVWDNQERRTDYAAAGTRACAAQGTPVNIKTLVKHVEHIEASWHSGLQYPPTSREHSVFPVDYVSLTERAARMGSDAMQHLTERLDGMETKDLIAVAKLGIGARQHERGIEAKDRRSHEKNVIAVFGFVSGHMDIPEVEVKDVTPIGEMRTAFEEERRRLEERAAG